MPEPLQPALADIGRLVNDQDRLVRAVASGRRRGHPPPEWRRVELRPVQLAEGRRVQVVRYDEQQAHTVNLSYGADLDRVLADLLGCPFASWRVEATDVTVQLRVTKKGEAQVHTEQLDVPRSPRLDHDRQKAHLLGDDELFGVLGASADKRRQVDSFLRALEPALPAVLEGEPERESDRSGPLRVVDLGCGNAYLTFAAYRYLTTTRGTVVDLVGVDTRPDARERNTRLAAELGADGARFVRGSAIDVPLEGADVVLALHACDTATDEALARAVRLRAPVVVAAPCCHHDLQRQLRQAGNGSVPEPYGLLGRHAILRERFADVLTDALRAALLRLLGYRVDVVEFVPSKHTPRNVLLRAVRTDSPPGPELRDEYLALTSAWGVRPALERMLPDELRP